MADSFKDRLNKAISDRDIKPAELARRTGINKSSITAWLKGDYEAKQDNIFKLSKALDVSEAWLMGLDDPRNESVFSDRINPVNKVTSPVAYKELKGAIAAGMPLEMFEVPDSVQVPVDVDRAFPNAYFLVVRGDSMNKIISEGMYVLITPCEELNNGEIGVIRVNGTASTLKRFYKMG
ncbi:MAG: helix-turn-helix domain-containing protein, partial [Trichococcus flocculiformis]